MTREPRRDSVLRLFVAAYPPPGAVAAMLDAARELPLAPHRLVPPEQVHLTLSFLGDTPRRDLDDVRESVGRAAAGLPAFELAPRRLITLPEGDRPRLVALETDAPPAALELVRRLATRLARRARQRPAEGFLPHLTLCRFQHTARPEPVERPVAMSPFAVAEIALVQSRLTPAGAVHTLVDSFQLESGLE